MISFEEAAKSFKRYPITDDRSLRVTSAADELLVAHALEKGVKKVITFNDRFGVVTGCSGAKAVVHYVSQQKAIASNVPNAEFIDPLTGDYSAELALVKVPKSNDLLEMQLRQLAAAGVQHVVCGFMTKYFSSNWLQIAGKYFEVVEQSLAKRKARLLVLSVPKTVDGAVKLKSWSVNGREYQQYPGVFSANKIDAASAFLLQHVKIKQGESLLDVACGNSVIGSELCFGVDSELTGVDDAKLAIASAKLNGSGRYLEGDDLTELSDQRFDVVVCNPPFHFDYETDINVSLRLFKQVKHCLASSGRFYVVANTHLNYKTHLVKMNYNTKVLATSDKYVIYELTH